MRFAIVRTIVVAGVLTGIVPGRALAAHVFVDCSGATPGAFTTIGAALLTLDRDLSHTLTVRGTCVEPVVIPGFAGHLQMQADPAGASIEWTGAGSAIEIFRSRSVTISGLTVRGRPVRIAASVVDLFDVTIEHSSGAGLSVANSTVFMRSSVVQHNAGQGLSLEPGVFVRIRELAVRDNGGTGISGRGADLDVEGALTVEENRGTGIDLSGGFARFNTGPGPNVIRANTAFGLNLSGTTAILNGRNVIQGNAALGVQAAHGGSLTFNTMGTGDATQAALIEGNGTWGLNIAATGSASFFGPHQIRGNGIGGMRIGSVARVQFFGSTEISGNQGPGVLVEYNSVLSLGAAVISGNTEEGTRVLRNGIANLDAAVITGNGVAAVSCDTTALVVAGTSTLGGAIKCGRIERENGPPRPGAIIVK